MRELILEGRILRKRLVKKAILMSLDAGLIVLSYLLAMIFRYYMELDQLNELIGLVGQLKLELALSVVILLSCQWLMKQYQSIWTLAGIEDFTLGTLSFIGGTMLNLVISLFFSSRIPLVVTFLAGIFAMISCNGIRIGWRLLRRMVMSQKLKGVIPSNTLIYGAGMAGSLVANEYRHQPQFGKKIIGFIDDDIEKAGTYIGKNPIFGTRDVLETVIQKYHIDELIVAISHLEESVLKSITLQAKKLNVVVKVMPGLFELIDGKFNVGMIREVEVEDLLARESIKLDHEGISDYLENQVVMVTGGGGSIGSELCRQIAKFQPK